MDSTSLSFTFKFSENYNFSLHCFSSLENAANPFKVNLFLSLFIFAMAYSSDKAKSQANKAIDEEIKFIKNIKKVNSSWVTDNFKPNLELIEDKLSKVPQREVGRPFRLSMPSDDQKLSDIGTKEDRFFIVSAQSIILDGLRFSLKDFFVEVLQELGIAPGQLTPNN